MLASFLLWVYPLMRGKQGRRWAKPASAFQYVLALIRIFRRWDIALPSAKTVKQKVRGLMRAFKDVYGAMALAPKRKEPMRYSMLQRIFALNEDTKLCDGLVWSPMKCPLCSCTCELLATAWRGGYRLGDLIGDHASKRADLTWCLGGKVVSDATDAQLANMREGDFGRLGPGHSKTDQFGQTWAPFGTVLPFHDAPGNAARMLRDRELAEPCHGTSRATTPLFTVEGRVPSHSALDRMLNSLLLTLFGAHTASTFSWHSVRSGLATSLAAAKCPDEQIMLCCRWASPESLRLYKRIGASESIDWVDQAEAVPEAALDSLQLTNVPCIESEEGISRLQDLYGSSQDAGSSSAVDADGTANVARALRKRSSSTSRERAVSPAAAPPPKRVSREDSKTSVARPASNLAPLTRANAVGRLVMVPRAVWPSYSCNEQGGLGWEAVVRSCTRQGYARLKFIQATTASGVRYADVDLYLSALVPL